MDDVSKTASAKVFGKKKQLEADRESLSQQLYRHNLELAQTNRTLELLRKIDTLVLESKDDIATLGQYITKAFMELPNYTMVAIMGNLPRTEHFQLLGFDLPGGAKPEFDHSRVRLDLHNNWVVSPDRIIAIDLQQYSNEDIARIFGVEVPLIETVRQTVPVKTLVASKLIARYRIVGVMVFGFAQTPENVNVKETALLQRLSEAVGIALDNKLLFDENQRVLRQLQQTNIKLKNLDKVKDDFISMASHQLRTPLTSVKGYLSMVLEGDTGQLPEMQRKLLNQAFVSSQRMVYLIADLLNVSRLKTGKFLIEPVPTNLAKVVDDEVKQLLETAKHKKLTLVYNKPENFPVLMIDETKIRQVIMNFMDNAIYYTPAGGKIVVEVKETDKTIQYTVTDNGIGIKKEDQPHLFGKFYRASNAKKARPDGTGLGLFMVKKVIATHGGSIIFSSEENKGSTFGFEFEKSKLQPPPKDDQPPAKP